MMDMCFMQNLTKGNDTDMTDPDLFHDFPTFPFADEFCVPVLEYKGVRISEGMRAVWRGDEEPFRIEAIRLNPTLRFWDGEQWHLAANCRIQT